MDHTLDYIAFRVEHDEMTLLLERIISLAGRVIRLNDSIDDLMGEKRERAIGLEDLQQAILPVHGEERLTSQDPGRSKISPKGRPLTVLVRVIGLLSSFQDAGQGRGVPRLARMRSPLVAHQVLFERWEIDIDDIEGPPPSPFDYLEGLVGGAHVDGANGLRSKILDSEGEEEEEEEEGSLSDGTTETASMSAEEEEVEGREGEWVVEVQNEAGKKRQEQGTRPNDQRVEFEQCKREPESKPSGLGAVEVQSRSSYEKTEPTPQMLETSVASVGVFSPAKEINRYLTDNSNERSHLPHEPKEASSLATDEFQEAILYVKSVLAAIPQDHPDRVGRLNNLASTFELRYEKTGTIDDLQRAIFYGKEALAATPQDHPHRAYRLDGLAKKFSMKYQRTRDIDDLQQVILYGKEALVVTPQNNSYRACRLDGLASKLDLKYERTRALGDLQQAVFYSKEALAATPQDHPHRASHIGNLANKLSLRYEQIRAIDDLQQAIFYSEGALAATLQGHPDRPSHLSNLARNLSLRYQQTGDIHDLQQTILYRKEALAVMPQDSPYRACRLDRLASTLSLKYEQSGDMEDLQQAILYGIEAFKATPRGHPHYAGHVCNLVNTLNSRYDRTGAMDHLQQLILYTKEILVVTPQDHPYRACRLDTLARNLSSKYMRTGAMEDLQQALLYSKEASAATAQSHPHRASHIANLATTLNLQYERTGAIKYLEQAIFYNKEALEATPKGHPNQADHLEALARRLSLKYRRTTAVDDFRQAILYGEVALAATTQDHPYRACCFDNLANTLGFRFEQTGAMGDLQQAILYGEKALETTLHHPDRAVHLNNLANRLCLRYERTGAMDDLKRAILYGEEALAATPLDYLYRACRLDSLAGRLGLRYKRTGYMEDLQQAILYGEAACAATPQDHSHRASHAGNLATTLSLRYERTGAMDDLQQAIFYSEEALVATPKDHPDQAEHLSSLASILSLRYDRSGDMDDIQQAILYSKQALAAMAQDHPSRACYLSKLANQLTRRYERTTFDHPGLKSAPSRTQEQMTSRAVDDLQQAILYGKEALIATPEDHPHRANHLNSLTTALDLKYEQTKAIEDLQQAILYGEEALAAVPWDHLNRAEYLGAAANRLLKRSELMSSAEDIGNCMLHLRASWSCSMSPPFHRVSAALLFARASYTLQVSEERSPLKGVLLESKELSTLLEESNSILEGAVLLLPRVSLRSLNRQDQQYNLFRLTGLAEDAASAALAAGKTAYDALKLLELSCGIMMGFAIDCRGDLSDLEGVDVELFKKFNRLRIEIDTPLPDRICSQDRTHITRRREQAIREMEETITEIRSLPGHEGFQLPPSSEELMSIAKYGPIVTFLSSRFRSDAIIVTSSVIYSIPLPKLHRDHREIPGRLGKIPGLTKGKLRTYAARNKELQEILFWLWDVAVGPVIQTLQLKKSGFTDLAHIWWIGVGVLNMAPFHAAGNYSDPSQTVFNYAISSYTPTIKALSYAREKDLTITKPDTQLLLITMPKTPGEKDLPDAEEEVARIVEVMKGSGSVLTEHLERPSAKDVLDRLQLGSCHAIHFACHGITDEKDPSSSHLVLLKNGEADKLTVQDISSRNTEVAQLAYLSACSTAHNPAMRLADEAIHIASGFQLAGFTHVVAAMWPSESRFCREISVDFYRSLFDGKEHHGIGEGHRKLRIAFYEAVKKVQKKYPNHPLKWAPFIHMGA